MTDHTLSFWECPEQLARSQDERAQREAWRQLGSAAHLVSNGRDAIQAGPDDTRLAQARPLLHEAEVDRYVHYHAKQAWGIKTYAPCKSPEDLDRLMRPDADRLVRHMRGFFAAARAARAAFFADTHSLLDGLHEAAALWGGTRPAEGLSAPLSAGAAVATRFDTSSRDGWAEAMQPARVLDDHFRALAVLPVGWRVGAARDRAAVLLGGGRSVARRLTMPVLGFEAAGRVLRLGVELLRDGTGECYADPTRLGLLPITRAFLDAAETAWAEALREAGADHAAGYDVRWWVVAPDAGPGLQVLDGASMGAALSVALVQLLRGHPIDPAVALTAEVLPGGRLKEVHAVGPKSRAVFALSPPLKYVVVHPDNLHEVETAAAEAKRDPAASVHEAATLADAVRHVSGLPTDLLHYYEALIAAPEGDKGDPAPAYGGRSLAQLFVTPDLLRIDPERRRQPPQRREDADGPTPTSALTGSEVRDLNEDALFNEAETENRLTWAEARAQWGRERARAVVLGAPGQGKSVLTQMLAREIAREGWQRLNGSEPQWIEDLPLPMVVPLNVLLERGLPPQGRDTDAPLRAVLVSVLEETPGCSGDAARYLAEHAHEGRAWLVLDALDEVGADQVSTVAWDRLFELLRRPSWRCRVLITTRPYGYDPVRVRLGETLFRLAPLSDGQQHALTDNWFRGTPAEILPGRERVESLRRRPAVRGMAQNAFLLSLLCGIAEGGEVSADVTRTQLYERALCRMLGGQERADAWMPTLRALAWYLFRTNENTLLLPNDRLLRILRTHPDAPEEETIPPEEPGRKKGKGRQQRAAIRLRDELRRKRLLVAVGARRAAMFAHRTFAEYLAASYLAECLSEKRWDKAAVRWGEAEEKRPVADLLDHKTWLPAWQEVIAFLGGLLERPRPLIELLADETKDDDFRHRLALASRALAERPATARSDLVDLVDQVTTEHFGLWLSQESKQTEGSISHITAALPALGVLNGRLGGEGMLSGSIPLFSRLAELLRDRSWYMYAAVRAVGALGTVAATDAIVTRLADLLHDDAPRVRSATAETVGALGAAAATDAILDGLVELLQDRDPIARNAAVRAVGALSTAAATKSFLARVTELLQDRSPKLRETAVQAVTVCPE